MSNPTFYIRVNISRIEPQLGKIALKAGVALDAVGAMGHTHLAVTGSNSAQSFFITDKPTEVRIPIPNTSSYTWCHKDGKLIINDRALLLVTTSRFAASINGTFGTSMSGQGSVKISHLLGDEGHNVCALPLEYSNWPAYSAVLTLSDIRLETSNKTPVRYVHFKSDKNMKDAATLAAKEMETIYSEAWKSRSKIVFKPAPNLTKSVMRVPVGISGSGFDLSANVVNTQPAFSDITMESMLSQIIDFELDSVPIDSVKSILGHSHESPDNLFTEQATSTLTKTFLDEKNTGVAAARFAPIVANALSIMAGFIVPYRADGRTVVLPTGLAHQNSESWKAEPVRAPFGMDDCDGSATLISSTLRRIKQLFVTEAISNASVKSKYPYLYGIFRSTVHYDVLMSVLAAKAAHANASDQDKASTQVAGHAVALLIPKTDILYALSRGTENNDITILQSRLNALYADKMLLGLPTEELKLLENWNDIREDVISSNGMFSKLRILAMEGTSPSDSTMFTPDKILNRERASVSLTEKDITDALSPSVCLFIKKLDADHSSHKNHCFYSEFVEIMSDIEHPLFDNKHLQHLGAASCHWIICKTSNTEPVELAGASPANLYERNYALTPLWVADNIRAKLLSEASKESHSNTLPMNEHPPVIPTENVRMLHKSLSHLQALENVLAYNDDNHTGDDSTIVTSIFSMASLVFNDSSFEVLELIAPRLRSLGVRALVNTNRPPITNLLRGPENNDIGQFTSMILEVPRGVHISFDFT